MICSLEKLSRIWEIIQSGLLKILYGIVIVTITIDTYFSMVSIILFIVPNIISQFTRFLSSVFQNPIGKNYRNNLTIVRLISIIGYIPFFQIVLSYIMKIMISVY